jgi:hypothetical protein
LIIGNKIVKSCGPFAIDNVVLEIMPRADNKNNLRKILAKSPVFFTDYTYKEFPFQVFTLTKEDS